MFSYIVISTAFSKEILLAVLSITFHHLIYSESIGITSVGLIGALLLCSHIMLLFSVPSIVPVAFYLLNSLLCIFFVSLV
jgi:hypothetical protein